MNTKPAKTGFTLKPKHLLFAALIFVIVSVAALVVGVFRTMKQHDAPADSPKRNKAQVEILSPRGASSTATTTTASPQAPNLPPPPAPAENHSNTAEAPTMIESAPAPKRTLTAKLKPDTESLAIEREVEPINVAPPHPAHTAPAAKPTTPAAAPVATPAPTQQPAAPAPKPAAPKPEAPASNKPKDVMDNLF